MEIKTYTRSDLAEYLKKDTVLEELRKYQEDNDFASQKWLLNIPAKRMIYSDVYENLLHTTDKKILDIGGGFCGLSRILIKNHDYTLVEVFAQDDHSKLKRVESEVGHFWENTDWYDFKPESYDYIIANDIFPNVDQRLGKFIKKFKPYAKKMILTLTCYDQKSVVADITEKSFRFLYDKLRRVNGDKITFTRAPSTIETNLILRESLGVDAPVLKPGDSSLFENGRLVHKIILT